MMRDLLIHVLKQPERALTLTASEWEIVLGQARQSRLMGRLAHLLLERDWLTVIPVGPRPYLEGALKLVDRQHHEVRWELDRIHRALRTLSGQVILLKGAAYFAADLPMRSGRLFSDVDILVPHAQLEAVESALMAAGWISQEKEAYNQRYYRQWMHELPPLTHIHRRTVIDVHHTITPPTSRFKVDGQNLISHAVTLKGDNAFFVLAPSDMVLHSAVHLFQDGEFGSGIRDLLDISDLLVHFGKSEDFWPNLFDRANELGFQTPLYYALFHVRRLFGFTAPAIYESRVEQLKPFLPSRILMAWLLELALRPNHPSCDTGWTALARWLLYVRSHALRMPPHLVLMHLARKAWMVRFPDKAGEKLA